MKCGIESGFSGIPWIDQFNLVNANDTHETEKAATGIGLSCNFEELERFELFFSKFVNAAREFFLPPERHSFGLVSNRSLLQYLGVEDSQSWLAMLKFAGCPSCSKILKEGNDLKSVLQMDNGIVSEVGLNVLSFICLFLLRNKRSYMKLYVLQMYFFYCFGSFEIIL